MCGMALSDTSTNELIVPGVSWMSFTYLLIRVNLAFGVGDSSRLYLRLYHRATLTAAVSFVAATVALASHSEVLVVRLLLCYLLHTGDVTQRL